MDTNRGVWSDKLQKSREIKWLLNSSNTVLRNIRSNTKFKSWELSKNWVEPGFISIDKSRPKLSATSRRVFVYDEW